MKKIFYTFLLFSFAFAVNAQDSTFPRDKMYAYQYKDNTIFTKSDRLSGASYKVEVMRIPFYDEKDPGLDMLRKHYGNLHMEHWKNRDVYVLLLGNFTTRQEAENLKNRLAREGFRDALIVKYQDGLRS